MLEEFLGCLLYLFDGEFGFAFALADCHMLRRDAGQEIHPALTLALRSEFISLLDPRLMRQ
jgi:hypothetical protein